MKRSSVILFLMIALTCKSQEHVFSSARSQDSLLNELKKAKEDSLKVVVLNNICSGLIPLGEYDKAIERSLESETIARKIGFKKGLIAAYNNLGIAFDYTGDYIRSVDYHTKALQLRQEMNDLKGISASYGNLAIVYEYLGKLPDALKCLYDALKIDEQIGDRYAIAVTNINMGSVYAQLQKYDESMKCFTSARDIYTELKADDGLAYAESGIGMVYSSQKNNTEAEKHILKSQKIFERLGDKQNVAANFINLGQIYLAAKKVKESGNAFRSALALNNEIGDKKGSVYSYTGLGNVFSLLKQFAVSKSYFDSAVHIAREIGCVECLKDIYPGYASRDSAASDFRSAFMNLKNFLVYKDSLISIENNNKASQAKLQYDFDKKAIADSLRNAEIKERDALKHEQEIRQQKIYSYGGLIGFILMLVIAAVSYRAYNEKRRTNVIIEKQKTDLEVKQKEIVDSITYAKRIQGAHLPTEEYIEKNINRLKRKS